MKGKIVNIFFSRSVLRDCSRYTHVVLLDMALEFGSVDPGDKILHVACDKERWIGNSVGSNTDVSLFHVRHSLGNM